MIYWRIKYNGYKIYVIIVSHERQDKIKSYTGIMFIIRRNKTIPLNLLTTMHCILQISLPLYVAPRSNFICNVNIRRKLYILCRFINLLSWCNINLNQKFVLCNSNFLQYRFFGLLFGVLPRYIYFKNRIKGKVILLKYIS